VEIINSFGSFDIDEILNLVFNRFSACSNSGASGEIFPV
jgi:hypothetical protein